MTLPGTIPSGQAIIRPNLDPQLQGRIVINYTDHIQSIWERPRTITQGGVQVLGLDGMAATNCVSCHSSYSNTMVPAGQLDLGSEPAANPDFLVSYIELTRNDNEQWEVGVNQIADRTRICDEVDADNNPIQVILNFPVRASVNRRSALSSNAFFACFEEDDSPNCGAFVQDVSAPPANCSDAGGTITNGGTITTKVFPATFAEAEALMDATDPMTAMSPSLTDSGQLLDLLLQTNCQACHSTGGGEVPHSDADNDTAYNALEPYINLVNPSASTFVFRLETLNHQCWDDCTANAAEMLDAITNFSNAVPEEDINNGIPPGSVVSQGSFNHFGLLFPQRIAFNIRVDRYRYALLYRPI